MSFSVLVKNELCKNQTSEACCLLAEMYGILLLGTAFSCRGVRVVTQHEALIKRIPLLCKRVFGFVPESYKKGAMTTFLIEDIQDLHTVFQAFGYDFKDAPVHLNRAVIEEDCCKASFLRGAFLAGGWVSQPDKKTHLEITTTHHALANELLSLLYDMEMHPGLSMRKNSYVLYLKGAESIEDFLTAMGAMRCAMHLMEAKVEKDLRNNINRKVNCETANLTKTVDAGLRQVNAIQKIEQKAGLSSLPQDLQTTARLRLEHPELSLTELAVLFPEKISKPGLSHRLRKLCEIAEKL